MLERARANALDENMTLDTNDLPDEMDLASSEYLQSFEFRLRGREKSLLNKLDLALKKIEEGTFGVCENCEEPIGKKRLEARPRPRSASSAKRIRSAKNARWASDELVRCVAVTIAAIDRSVTVDANG